MEPLLVIGSLNMDLVVRTPRIPAVGETIIGDSLAWVCGGKGANQAVTLGKLGARAAMLGSVGLDSHGDKLLAGLKAAGVEVDRIQRLAETPSGLAVIEVDDLGFNSIVVAPGANGRTGPEYVEANQDLIARSSAVIMQLEIPLETVATAARLAKSMGKLVILDPAPAARLPDDLYRQVDILKPNEIELAHLAEMAVENLDQAELAARKLLERGVGTVVVTLGGQGALMVGREGARHVPAAHQLAPVDTTAAGDSFTAAMAMMLVEGFSLIEAVQFACKISGIVVSRPGAQSSIPSAEEVRALWPKV